MAARVNFPKGLPRFKMRRKVVARLLNDMADTAVNQIYNDTQQGKDIDGRKFKKLKVSTARAKRKKGQPVKPLIATGLMSRVHKSKKASSVSLRAEVSVAKARDDIAEYHNEGEGNLPKREFFGVGKPLESKLDKVVKLKLEKLIKTTWKKR